MNVRFLRTVAYVLEQHEGGESDHPQDPGGRTRFGISERAHPALWDAAHPRGPTLIEALETYWSVYWLPMKCDEILFGPLAAKVFDLAVNMGTHRAAMLLQYAVNDLGVDSLLVDGEIGPVTLRAVNTTRHPEALVAAVMARQLDFYKTGNPTFRQGWFRRAAWNGRA